MPLSVRHSSSLQQHLETYEVDGTTVGLALFDGGRLNYPGRREIEHTLGSTEPFTLEHEARIIEGLSPRAAAGARFLARNLRSWIRVEDPTLDLLWASHEAYSSLSREVSIDRLVAALVMIHELHHALDGVTGPPVGPHTELLKEAALALLMGLEAEGLYPTSESLEELFDGAPPACVGLGMVDIDWRDDGNV